MIKNLLISFLLLTPTILFSQNIPNEANEYFVNALLEKNQEKAKMYINMGVQNKVFVTKRGQYTALSAAIKAGNDVDFLTYLVEQGFSPMFSSGVISDQQYSEPIFPVDVLLIYSQDLNYIEDVAEYLKTIDNKFLLRQVRTKRAYRDKAYRETLKKIGFTIHPDIEQSQVRQSNQNNLNKIISDCDKELFLEYMIVQKKPISLADYKLILSKHCFELADVILVHRPQLFNDLVSVNRSGCTHSECHACRDENASCMCTYFKKDKKIFNYLAESGINIPWRKMRCFYYENGKLHPDFNYEEKFQETVFLSEYKSTNSDMIQEHNKKVIEAYINDYKHLFTKYYANSDGTTLPSHIISVDPNYVDGSNMVRSLKSKARNFTNHKGDCKGELVCKIGFVLDKDGQLKNFSIVKSSGCASFDQYCIAILSGYNGLIYPGLQAGNAVAVRSNMTFTRPKK